MNMCKKIDLSTMIAVTMMMVVILFNTSVNGQRTQYDIDREEPLRSRRPSVIILVTLHFGMVIFSRLAFLN